MNLNLSETIRRFRKVRGLTQEQLAEALDVSVGAVSKWELGSSMPDLCRLVEMAEFFETSVDALLGYKLQGGGAEKSLAEIKRCRAEKAKEQGQAAAEKALRQYPNSFDIVYQCAVFYRLIGTEQGDRVFLQRALSLYERAIPLLPQNTDREISLFNLQNAVAQIYQALGDSETALRKLRECNFDRHNDGSIGFILAQSGRAEEALPYLSDALAAQLVNLFQLCIGFVNALPATGRKSEALELALCVLDLFERVKLTERATYFSKLTAVLLATCALFVDEPEERRTYLRRSAAEAKRFDTAPDYTFEAFRFYYGNRHNTAFDDIGISATEAIRHAVMQDAALYSEWERLQHETDET